MSRGCESLEELTRAPQNYDPSLICSWPYNSVDKLFNVQLKSQRLDVVFKNEILDGKQPSRWLFHGSHVSRVGSWMDQKDAELFPHANNDMLKKKANYNEDTIFCSRIP